MDTHIRNGHSVHDTPVDAHIVGGLVYSIRNLNPMDKVEKGEDGLRSTVIPAVGHVRIDVKHLSLATRPGFSHHTLDVAGETLEKPALRALRHLRDVPLPESA